MTAPAATQMGRRYDDVAEPENGERDRALVANDPLPFEELVLPLVQHARATIVSASQGTHAALTDDAHRDLERALLKRLSRIGARVFFAEFSVYRALHQPAIALWLLADRSSAPNDSYHAFVRHMRAGRMAECLAAYPVMARLLATATELWVASTLELLERLDADRARLHDVLGLSPAGGRVQSISCDSGDAHEGGRTVHILTFESGARVVYKPRPLALERCFADLVAWLSVRETIPTLRVPTVLDCRTHGWMEFVEHAPCADDEGVARFYERAGALLCLVYALGGSDFHFENVLASGEFPVLIDMEALLTPQLHTTGVAPRGATARAQKTIEHSVLKVGLLPSLKVLGDGVCIDLGGLGSTSHDSATVPVTRWKFANTGFMKLGHALVHREAGGSNMPIRDGMPVEAARHSDAIVRGFHSMYAALLARQAELLSNDGPLASFRLATVRFLFRNTSLYGTLLERTLQPKYLTSDALRTAQFEPLYSALLAEETRPAHWPLVAEEFSALERMDIPLFSTTAHSVDVELADGRRVPGCFRASAYDNARARVTALSLADCAHQLDLVRGALDVHSAANDQLPVRRSTRTRSPATTLAPLFLDDAEREARALLDVSWSMLMRDDADDLSWIGVSYLPHARRFTLGPASTGPFDGLCGVAIVAAALSRVSADAEAADMARRATAAVRRRIRDAKNSPADSALDIGLACGAAGIVYSLTLLARLLDDATLLDDARLAAEWITADRIHADTRYSLLGGAAGALVALLALHSATGDLRALTLATECGEHLLSARLASVGAAHLGLWPTWRGRAEVGLSHGTAGIACALARLARTTGRAEFADAAHLTFQLEEDLAREEPDVALSRTATRSWLAGDIGIALARVGALNDASPELHADVARAAGAVSQDDHEGLDTLCMGRMAGVDLLLVAGRITGDAAYRRHAESIACRTIERARSRGGYITPWEDSYGASALFHGALGIGYQLLRVAAPDALPSLLLWE